MSSTTLTNIKNVLVENTKILCSTMSKEMTLNIRSHSYKKREQNRHTKLNKISFNLRVKMLKYVWHRYLVPQPWWFKVTWSWSVYQSPTDYAFKYDINCPRWTLSFKISIDHIKRVIIHGVVSRALSTMTNDGRKYIYSGRNIRDFGQLLTSLHPNLWHVTREREKTHKKTHL